MGAPQVKASESTFEKTKQAGEFATVQPQAATAWKESQKMRAK